MYDLGNSSCLCKFVNSLFCGFHNVVNVLDKSIELLILGTLKESFACSFNF